MRPSGRVDCPRGDAAPTNEQSSKLLSAFIVRDRYCAGNNG